MYIWLAKISQLLIVYMYIAVGCSMIADIDILLNAVSS